MGKSSQRKGRGGELELVQLLHSYGYTDVRPGKPISYGEEPDVVGLPGVHIECKRVERLNVPEAMQQAERDAQRFKDGIPVLFHRRNRQPWLVTLHLKDFIQIYRGGGGDGGDQDHAGPDRGQADSSGPAD